MFTNLSDTHLNQSAAGRFGVAVLLISTESDEILVRPHRSDVSRSDCGNGKS